MSLMSANSLKRPHKHAKKEEFGGIWKTKMRERVNLIPKCKINSIV